MMAFSFKLLNITSLVLLFSSMLSECNGQSATARTFFGTDSYIMYPRLNPGPQRLVRFSFRTSERSGLLLYSEWSGNETVGEYLLVKLENGSLNVTLRLHLGAGLFHSPSTKILGRILNNNEQHTFTVHHNPSNSRFSYKLDSDAAVINSYPSNLVPNFGSNGVFIGGVPLGSTPFANETHFAGCVEDVLFASTGNLNVNTASSQLQTLEPVQECGMLLNSCTDPCEGKECGMGTCVTRWPNHAFCDCRNSNLIGENCTEDPSTHRLCLNSTNQHTCYKPVFEPPLSSNTVSIQLATPIPAEGTILIAHGDNGSSFFSIQLEDYQVVYEYRDTSNVTRSIRLDTFLNDSTLYQIDLTTSTDRYDLVLLESSSGEDVVTEIERRGSNPSEQLYLPSTIFTTVCLGGSLLEVVNYVGVIQRVFFNYNSLTEERNFLNLEAENIERSDVISFERSETPRSLDFTSFSLRSHQISFQARFVDDHVNGALLTVENDVYEIAITAFNRILLLISNNKSAGTFLQTNSILVTITDGEWHSYQVRLNSTESGTALILMLNGASYSLSNPGTSTAINSLLDSPLKFGSTNTFASATFQGCLGEFEFQRTPNSVPFRPNLEAVPRTNSLFDTDRCLHCSSGTTSRQGCVNGEMCVDRGVGMKECACPQGFTGNMCQDPLARVSTAVSTTDSNEICHLVITTTAIPTTATPTISNMTCHIQATSSTPTTATPTSDTPTTATPTTNMPITTSNDSSTPNTTEMTTIKGPSPSNDNSIGTGGWIGIGVLIAVLVLLVVGSVVIGCVIYRRGARIRGFYRTHESNGPEASIVRYSASLRQLSSEIVNLDKNHSKEVSWTHKNGDYNNGTPPTMTSVSINRTPINSNTRDREFYL